MNNFPQPPTTQQVSFGPMELLNMRLALEQIHNPSPKIREAKENLDSILHTFIMGFQPQPNPTLSNSPDFPYPTN